MLDSTHPQDSSAFRRVLIQALKRGMAGFDLKRLQAEQGVSDEVVRAAARSVFLS